MLGQPQPYLINLKNLEDKDLELVGREAMQNSFLHRQKIPSPASFVVTSRAFDDFLTASQLVEPVMELISKLSADNYPEICRSIQKLILETKIPSIIERPIVEAYKNLSSGGALPFVSLQISNIIQPEFTPQNHHHHLALNIYGVEKFIEALKLSWAELFSIESTKLRLDKNYEGVLTISVIVQKMIRPEVSGSVYSLEKDSDKFIYVNAMYGLEEIDSKGLNAKDIYKVDIETLEVVERNIVQQTEMIVRKGKAKEGEDANMRVKISPEWQGSAKIDDERITKLAELTLKINEYLSKKIELSWGLEAGEINIFNIHDSRINGKVEVYPSFRTTKEESLVETVSIVDIKDIDQSIDKAKLQNETKIEAPVPLATSEEIRAEIASEINTKSEIKEEPKTINLLTQIYIDGGSMTSETLSQTDKWKRSFIHGNDLILNNQHLPENSKTQQDILSYIANLSLQMNNISRLLNGGDLIYALSSIDSFTLKLLGEEDFAVKGFYDERFLNNEEALLIEIAAIKKSRNEAKQKNISLQISSVRSYENLMKIKRLISSEGLRRSPSFKMYAEVSIPSFIYDLEKIDNDDVDGIIINMDLLARNSLIKSDLEDKDYIHLIDQLKKIKQLAKEKKLTLGIKLDSKLPDKIFKEIILLQPTILIPSFTLTDKDIELVENTEKEFFENMLIPLNKRGRKIKKLF